MRQSIALCRRAALAAAVPANYSNTPYKKNVEPPQRNKTRNNNSSSTSSWGGIATPARPHLAFAPMAAVAPIYPSATSATLGTTFIDPSSSTVATSFNNNYQIKSFRQRVCAATDVSMRPLLLMLDAQTIKALEAAGGDGVAHASAAHAAKTRYGELLEELSCRWARKFYGNVTFAPRNYPYPSSRWLARRFQMKKHRIIKRFRFRRYKLAAVANLPFAKMIRVGMLPELKSSKTKKGDAVDGGLATQLVSAARNSSSTSKAKGKRSRPKSKYQV